MIGNEIVVENMIPGISFKQTYATLIEQGFHHASPLLGVKTPNTDEHWWFKKDENAPKIGYQVLLMVHILT